MKTVLIALINTYRRIFSPDHGFLVKHGVKRPGNVCVFYPSCSEYAVLSIEKYGTVKGSWKSCGRILRCHPWQKNHIDFP